MEVSSPPVASVVVVTDQASLAASVMRILRDENTQVRAIGLAPCQDDGVPIEERPDIILLDRAADRQVARRILQLRRRWPTIGLVVLEAADETDVASLLDAGADDAVTSGSTLLTPRLHAHARRARTLNAGMRLAVGDIVFDREDHRVWVAGAEVPMTPREFALLDCMFRNAPSPVGATTLAEFVWGSADAPAHRSAVEVYIGYLRRKLARSHQVMIRTVRGVGYRFDRRV